MILATYLFLHLSSAFLSSHFCFLLLTLKCSVTLIMSPYHIYGYILEMWRVFTCCANILSTAKPSRVFTLCRAFGFSEVSNRSVISHISSIPSDQLFSFSPVALCLQQFFCPSQSVGQQSSWDIASLLSYGADVIFWFSCVPVQSFVFPLLAKEGADIYWVLVCVIMLYSIIMLAGVFLNYIWWILII